MAMSVLAKSVLTSEENKKKLEKFYRIALEKGIKETELTIGLSFSVTTTNPNGTWLNDTLYHIMHEGL